MSDVQLEKIPRSVEEFVVLRDQVAQTPEGGAAMMVVALLLVAEDEELGWPCLTIAVDRAQLQEGTKGYQGWELRARDRQLISSQIRGRGHVARSYFQGATPENGYALPAPPCKVAFSSNPYSGDPAEGETKVFVASSGAASPRPVRVRRNNRGLWKAVEWSSLLVGVREPEVMTDDEL